VFAMEYVEGLDLSRIVHAKGPMPVRHACYCVHQAALALNYAHQQGMVHRDIKPSNLMLSHEGNRPVIKLLDFGLARAVSEPALFHADQADTTVHREGAVELTRTGQFLGTPAFRAPEQFDAARQADHRVDIYSLGCTLYFLLSGHTPFQGMSLNDIFRAHQSTDARPLNLERPEVPPELALMVARMMAKDPAQRFQDTTEVAVALTPFFKKPRASPQTRDVGEST